jgi:hypothetical protein
VAQCRRRILALAVSAAIIHGASAAMEAQAGDERRLRIELVVFGGLGESQVDMVRREVDAIWAAQAVRIEWSPVGTPGCVRVVIDRPASMLPSSGGEEQWSVAASRIAAGQVSPPIYVSVDAAERVVRAASPPYSAPALAGIMVTRVLGRAIAHELAHILLNTRVHTRHGLLRATFTADDFVFAGQEGFRLDTEQLARARHHELLVIPAAAVDATGAPRTIAGTTVVGHVDPQTLQSAIEALPRRPERIVMVDGESTANAAHRMRGLDAFVPIGSRIIYLRRQSVTLRCAEFEGGACVLALAAVIWHEMAHAEGLGETRAREREEALWKSFVLSGRVDSAAGLSYLAELRRRR